MQPPIICAFEGINPIDRVEAGIILGQFSSHYSHITGSVVPLSSVSGSKDIYLVCFENCTVRKDEYIELRRNGPNYLLGLMAQVSEGKMPEELLNKDLLVMDDKESSIFTDHRGNDCFLCVRRNYGSRSLNFTSVHKEFNDTWAFLTEDLES